MLEGDCKPGGGESLFSSLLPLSPVLLAVHSVSSSNTSSPKQWKFFPVVAVHTSLHFFRSLQNQSHVPSQRCYLSWQHPLLISVGQSTGPSSDFKYTSTSQLPPPWGALSVASTGPSEQCSFLRHLSVRSVRALSLSFWF